MARREHPHATYSATLELDLADVKPSLAGPKRPQDRVLLEKVKDNFHANLEGLTANRRRARPRSSAWMREGGDQPQAEHLAAKPKSKIRIHDQDCDLTDGSVVIAAITSCTNTSNPAVMLGAGLLARNAVRLGLKAKPWVKTSLGPGSLVVTDYLKKAGVLATWRSSASSSSATAAPPASATPARCRMRYPRASPRTTWWSRRCCRATETSKAACTRK